MNFGGFYSFSSAPARKNPLSSQLPTLFSVFYILVQHFSGDAKTMGA